MNPKVDTYLIDGCGRCAHYKTPNCKVLTWSEEIKQLRRIVLDCGLYEGYKWNQPCYTLKDKNILMVAVFKDNAFISFFKGTLLRDEHQILVPPGENSQASRLAKFTSVEAILKMESVLKDYIYEAIALEKAGKKVVFKKNPEPIPDELLQMMKEKPDLKKAFEALTPGRQRGYILYFSQPKKTETRTSRIIKLTPKILSGKGFHD